MKKVNFQEKKLVHFKGIVLCDEDNIPKVYSGVKNATATADKVNGRIQQITPLRQKFYVVK